MPLIPTSCSYNGSIELGTTAEAVVGAPAAAAAGKVLGQTSREADEEAAVAAAAAAATAAAAAGGGGGGGGGGGSYENRSGKLASNGEQQRQQQQDETVVVASPLGVGAPPAASAVRASSSATTTAASTTAAAAPAYHATSSAQQLASTQQAFTALAVSGGREVIDGASAAAQDVGMAAAALAEVGRGGPGEPGRTGGAPGGGGGQMSANGTSSGGNALRAVGRVSPPPLNSGGFGAASSHDGSSNSSSTESSTAKWQERLSLVTQMIYYASEGNVAELQRLLDGGADVNLTDYDGRSALHLAASEGHLGAVQLLLARGANVNPRDRWGHTPLADAGKASSEGKVGQFSKIIELLKSRGGMDGGVHMSDDWEIDPRELDFSRSKLIGKGAFGEIRRVMWRGTPVAVKTVLPALSNDVQIVKEFRDEVFLLPKLRHPNVVQFLGCVTRSQPLCLITEYLPGGDLHDVLKSRGGPLPPRVALAYALDIARGMNYLHNHKPEAIIHRDLKPRNLLRDGGDHMKVADFGLSKLVKVNALHDMYKMTGETGSYRYMAPEVFKHQAYDRSVDVYSFAVILYEMFEGLPPFAKTLTAEGVAWKVAMEGVRPPFKSKLYPDGVKELISQCWAGDPMERPCFMEVIEGLEDVERNLLQGSRGQ